VAARELQFASEQIHADVTNEAAWSFLRALCAGKCVAASPALAASPG
jgi:hypothetical protein